MNKTAFAALIEQHRIVVLDGGLATELEARGHEIGGVLWSAILLRDDPRAIVDAHRAYLDSGAEIVISASYQASRAGFHQLGIDADDADALIVSSVSLARQASDEFMDDDAKRDNRPLVAASIGPYGAVLMDGSEYTGNYGVPDKVLHDFHAQRLALLDNSDADVLACETIPSLQEAQVLATLLSATRTPAWISFSCRDGNTLSDGTPLAEAAAMLKDHPNVLAIGINCTPPQFATALVERIATAAPDKAIVVYPNSGEHYAASDSSWSGPAASSDVAVADWIAAGATLIGGCCRVGPDEISAISVMLHGSETPVRDQPAKKS